MNIKFISMRSVAVVLLVFCLALPIFSVAQQNESDALYLINGSIIRGKVLESIPGQGVKIEIVGNNILVIPENEVQKVIMREGTFESNDLACRHSGFEIFPQAHFYGGSDQSGGFSVSGLYTMPFRLSAGIGTGVEWFNGAKLPLFAIADYKFLKGDLSPFVYGQAGYAFALENDPDNYYYYGSDQKNYGGILLGAGAGIRKDFSSHAAFTFSVGYRYQKSRMTSEYNIWYDGDPSHMMNTERIEKFNRISISLGFLFN
jgi:hypothetical protein